MKATPKKLTGDHELVPWLNRVLDCIIERTPLSGHECEIDYISGQGFRPKPRQPKPSAGGGISIVAAPLNMVFRGEYDSGSNYSPNDVVTVQNGDNGGAFLVTVPVPAGSVSEPSNGASFVQFSSFTFGQWT